MSIKKDVEAVVEIERLMSTIKAGWSVQITRKDGSKFLVSAGTGNLPPIWVHRNRKWAVAHKKDLQTHGFRVKVVKVLYVDPIVVE